MTAQHHAEGAPAAGAPDAHARQDLEAIIWHVFPRATAGQVTRVLAAADAYAADNAGITATRRAALAAAMYIPRRGNRLKDAHLQELADTLSETTRLIAKTLEAVAARLDADEKMIDRIDGMLDSLQARVADLEEVTDRLEVNG